MRALPALSAVAALSICLLGCDDKPKPAPTATASASATAATTSQAPTMPPPKPLDVAGLKQALKCGSGGHGPCGVLDAFTACTEWNPVSQSGDSRWLGEGSVVTKGAFVDQITLMRSKRVPLDEVGPGQLPAKIGIAALPDDLSTELGHARKAINAFKRGDVPKQNINAAITFVKQKDDWPDAFSMQAEQYEVYVAVEGGAHLCYLENQRLLVVKLSGNREHKADGVYATLWAVTW